MKYVYIDIEVSNDDKIIDIGAIKNKAIFHSSNIYNFAKFIKGEKWFVGHNIINHDLKYLAKEINFKKCNFIDTLYVSPLLFPKKPYHRLLKDDKLQVDELNNPVNDCLKAQILFQEEIMEFENLENNIKLIYSYLLSDKKEFEGFFNCLKVRHKPIDGEFIKKVFEGRICSNCDVDTLMREYPIELAYALSLINCNDKYSITPFWVLRNFPLVENVVKLLRNTPCDKCEYCKRNLDVHKGLKKFFGFDNFRTYNGLPLQEEAAKAAVCSKSLLAVFPTGGGKSITFQLPALMAGYSFKGLTVVISPLLSLMKDQVDNLDNKGIVDAVTLNGLQNAVERKEVIERVRNGNASLLYISPEALRSRVVEELLLSRNIARFVIDEAHCFSSWGQDFRVDYLYIGEFIKKLQERKNLPHPIPVSCFTATAKKKVITDICNYFKDKLDIELEKFTSDATRENLEYIVVAPKGEELKYEILRYLIKENNCSTIVYVTRTKTTKLLATKLNLDGISAVYYNGKMDPKEKVLNQEEFISNKAQVIVATSAFGMGVDKSDVKLVVHYEISDSLENYVQEAGRAGRDQSLKAKCYVLFCNNDLDNHFIMLSQTKLSIQEIQNVFKAIKDLSKNRTHIQCSALEIARQAGFDESKNDVETKVKTAILALENAGYIKRGQNVPKLYATSILVRNFQDAQIKIDNSVIFSDDEKKDAKRIIRSLISSRSVSKAGNDDNRNRIDFLAAILGLEKDYVIYLVNKMKQIQLLEDLLDMNAYIKKGDNLNKPLNILNNFIELERFLLNKVNSDVRIFNLKELNDEALKLDIKAASIKNIRKINYFWIIKNYIVKEINNQNGEIMFVLAKSKEEIEEKIRKRNDICTFVIEELYRLSKSEKIDSSNDEIVLKFSLVKLFEAYKNQLVSENVTLDDVEDSLLFLTKIEALSLEGGFLIIYNGMKIERLVKDNKIRYKNEDYKLLSEYYEQKTQQIHIVGEYANLMINKSKDPLKFVQDYFAMDYKEFIRKYFETERREEIKRNITPQRHKIITNGLSKKQQEIIDDRSKYIVVAAGPGSCKTRVLVHKLASLLLLEEVKHERLLMLTFSRSAANEFKKRLKELIGETSYYIEIKTFHSYCFDLLGKIGNLDDSKNIVLEASEKIINGEVEMERITKSVVVIDEAQDMDENEFALITALMQRNEDMRVLAVGDDDQNIFSFRGASSLYLKKLSLLEGSNKHEMNINYRSGKKIVDLANKFARTMVNRLKEGNLKAAKKEEGIVEIIKNKDDLIIPAFNNFLKRNHSKKVAFLTTTNEEAYKLNYLFKKANIECKLIQSLGTFKLYNLIEVRYILMLLEKSLNKEERCISSKNWKQMKELFTKKYASSSCYENIISMLNEFESTNKIMMYSDFVEFIKESKYEDFYSQVNDKIIISTIHKAKGQEYDVVYLLLNNIELNEDTKKEIYVGLTRAKEELYIHYNNYVFDNLNMQVKEDNKDYGKVNEIAIQLGYHDIYLSFFKENKKQIMNLVSGQALTIDEDGLSALINGDKVKVVKFSKKFIQDLNYYNSKGYNLVEASIEFIVAWKDKEEVEETPIILPVVTLKK